MSAARTPPPFDPRIFIPIGEPVCRIVTGLPKPLPGTAKAKAKKRKRGKRK